MELDIDSLDQQQLTDPASVMNLLSTMAKQIKELREDAALRREEQDPERRHSGGGHRSSRRRSSGDGERGEDRRSDRGGRRRSRSQSRRRGGKRRSRSPSQRGSHGDRRGDKKRKRDTSRSPRRQPRPRAAPQAGDERFTAAAVSERSTQARQARRADPRPTGQGLGSSDPLKGGRRGPEGMTRAASAGFGSRWI